MAEVQQEEQAVTLVYRPTVTDMTDALHARMRGTATGRRTRRLLLFTGVAGLLLFVLDTVSREDDLTRRIIALTVTFFALGSHFLLPRLQARQLHQLTGRQGEFRATVDHGGIRVTTRDTETTANWELYPRYTETDELFVLLSADKHGVGVVLLPKRGVLVPEDVDRLRGVLEQHVQRV